MFIYRIKWPKLQRDLSNLPFFFRTLNICKNLERLALITEARKRNPTHYTPLQDSILRCIKGAPHLVALCLVIRSIRIMLRLVSDLFIFYDAAALWVLKLVCLRLR